ncbi:MAG: nucleotidyltransferase domain-containing protein [Candidatus Bipolaricaulaceae bacterium]
MTREELLRAELARLLEFLKQEEPPPEKVILFGSVGRDEPVEEWTDLDLVIVQRTELPFLQRLRRFHERFAPQVAMDVLIYTPEEFAELMRTRRFFREEVLEKGRVIYERGQDLV